MDKIALPFEKSTPPQWGALKKTRAKGAYQKHDTPTNNRRTRPDLEYSDHIRLALGVPLNLRVDCLDIQQSELHMNDWRDLISRAAENNIFYEPAFALAAAKHLPEAGQPRFAFVYDDKDGTGQNAQLLGILPFTVSKRDIFTPIIRNWQHVNSALAVPLIDKSRPQEVIIALLEHFETQGFCGVLFSKIMLQGVFATSLQQVLEQREYKRAILSQSRRAALLVNFEAELYFKNNWRTKKLKDLGRQRRRLNDINPLTLKINQKTNDIEQAVERFLTLEATGWKGRNGTGLVQRIGRATFARAMMQEFAITQQIKIYELYCGQILVASGIVFISAQSGSFWKITHDEHFNKFSPGVLLTQNITEDCLASKQLLKIDSCAIENHPMIDSLWADRQYVADMLVSVSAGKSVRFWLAKTREIIMRKARQSLRAIYIKLKAGKNN